MISPEFILCHLLACKSPFVSLCLLTKSPGDAHIFFMNSSHNPLLDLGFLICDLVRHCIILYIIKCVCVRLYSHFLIIPLAIWIIILYKEKRSWELWSYSFSFEYALDVSSGQELRARAQSLLTPGLPLIGRRQIPSTRWGKVNSSSIRRQW